MTQHTLTAPVEPGDFITNGPVTLRIREYSTEADGELPFTDTPRTHTVTGDLADGDPIAVVYPPGTVRKDGSRSLWSGSIPDQPGTDGTRTLWSG